MADISLVIDRSKNVFAFSPLNQFAKSWLSENVGSLNVVNFENTLLSDESVLLNNIKTLVDGGLYVEVWNKKDLTEIPESTSLL